MSCITKAGPRHRVGVVVPRAEHATASNGVRQRWSDCNLTGQSYPLSLRWAPLDTSAQEYLDQRTTAMAESQVNFANSTLLSSPLCVPSLPEQRRIAEILDTLDEAIRRTEQIIAKLKQIKQGLLHDLLTRGIDENGELRDPERHPEQFKDSPLGRFRRSGMVRHLERADTCIYGTSVTSDSIRTGPLSG